MARTTAEARLPTRTVESILRKAARSGRDVAVRAVGSARTYFGIIKIANGFNVVDKTDGRAHQIETSEVAELE